MGQRYRVKDVYKRQEIKGNKHKDTRIDEKGNLYVSKQETSGELKVKAVSKVDANKFGEAVVKIKKAQVQVPGTNTNNNNNHTTTCLLYTSYNGTKRKG